MKKVVSTVVGLGLLVAANAWDFTYQTANTMYLPQSKDCGRVGEDVFQDLYKGIQKGQYKYVQGNVTNDDYGRINGYGSQIQVGVKNGVPMIINIFSDNKACRTIMNSYGIGAIK